MSVPTLSSSVSSPPSSPSSSIAGQSVAAVFLFDPTQKPPEGHGGGEEALQDAKLIYYHPSCCSIEEKRSQIGMTEGLIAFTRLFTGSDKAVSSVHTAQHVLVMYECEPNLWITMALRNPRDAEKSSIDEITESVLSAVLRNIYRIFHLLHGPLRSFLSKQPSKGELTDLLEDFIPAVIQTIHPDKLTIFNELDGFHFGPVERSTYLSIQSFLSILRRYYPFIRYTALLYEAYLIYSGLSQEDMSILYSYLVSYNGSISSKKLNNPPFGRIPTAASQRGGGSSSFGRSNLLVESDGFLLGPSSSQHDSSSSLFVPTVTLLEGSSGHLVVLLYQGLMLLLILDDVTDRTLDVQLLNEIRDTLISIPGGLRDLILPINEQFARIMGQEDAYRFVYFNVSNNATRVSNRSNGMKEKGPTISPAETQIIGDLHEAMNIRETGNDEERSIKHISYKSYNSGWISGETSFDREFYLLLDGNTTTFTRSQEESARFAQIHFSNIFTS